VSFLEAAEAVAKISLSLKSSHHIKFILPQSVKHTVDSFPQNLNNVLNFVIVSFSSSFQQIQSKQNMVGTFTQFFSAPFKTYNLSLFSNINVINGTLRNKDDKPCWHQQIKN
jgi:hypothetical protein